MVITSWSNTYHIVLHIFWVNVIAYVFLSGISSLHSLGGSHWISISLTSIFLVRVDTWPNFHLHTTWIWVSKTWVSLYYLLNWNMIQIKVWASQVWYYACQNKESNCAEKWEKWRGEKQEQETMPIQRDWEEFWCFYDPFSGSISFCGWALGSLK